MLLVCVFLLLTVTWLSAVTVSLPPAEWPHPVQEEGYQEALKCDGTDLDGQQLRVQKCVSAGQHASKAKKAAATSDATDATQTAQKQPPAPKVCLKTCLGGDQALPIPCERKPA